MTRMLVTLCGIVLGAALVFAAPADKSRTLTGTVAKIQASERALEVTVADGTQERLLWNADTKISGILTPGARVTVRYVVGADGKNLALQITVARG